MSLEAQRLQRLIELGRSLLSELDLEALLRRVLEVARELTGARYAALGILDERRVELERFIVSGIDDKRHRAIGELPRGRGVLGVLISDPRPLRLSDVGSHPSSYGFPPGHPPMGTFLGVPIAIRGEAFGNLYLTEKADGDFTAEDEEALVVLAGWAAIAIDNARVHRAVRGRRDELERAVRGFEATTDLARAIGAEVELPVVLDLVAKRARALADARSVLVVLRPEGDDFEVAAAAGAARDAVGLRRPVAGSLSAEVIRSRRTWRLPDVSLHPGAAFAQAVGARTALYAPLVFRGDALGVLLALDSEAEPSFTPEDERVLGAFSASAASAIATAQNVERRGLRLSIEAAESERRRWARELHDETLQQLGALRVLLSGARRRAGDREALGGAVDDAVEMLGEAIAELRALITELRPAALDQLGVAAALEALVARTRRLASFEVAMDVSLGEEDCAGPARYDPSTESAIYRIVQEALTNVGRHAGASHAEVRVAEADGSVTITVRDDGAGFETDGSRRGFGLIGMHERAALVGGAVDVESAPGRGTTVHARVPARRGARAGDTAAGAPSA